MPLMLLQSNSRLRSLDCRAARWRTDPEAQVRPLTPAHASVPSARVAQVSINGSANGDGRQFWVRHGAQGPRAVTLIGRHGVH